MNETVEKIDLFIKRDKLGKQVVKIIEEKGLKTDAEIEKLDEHKKFIKITEQLKNKFS